MGILLGIPIPTAALENPDANQLTQLPGRGSMSNEERYKENFFILGVRCNVTFRGRLQFQIDLVLSYANI